LWWMVLLYVANTCLLLNLALRGATRPATGLAWVAIGLCLPILGPVIYFMLSGPFAERRSRHAPSVKTETPRLPSDWSTSSQHIARTIHSMTGSVPVHSAFRVFHEGDLTFAALFKSLQNAKSTIDIEFFIVRYDHVGQRLVQTLCDKAASGVRIRFLRDGVGSLRFPRKAIQSMQEHGIECRTFFPLQFPWLTPQLNHRDHCKIVVIDGKEAFVGGINIGDEYTGHKPGVGPWRDTHMQLRGEEAARQLQAVFDMNWGVATPDRRARAHPRTRRKLSPGLLPIRHSIPSLADPSLAGEWAEELAPIPQESAVHTGNWMHGLTQTVESGPDRRIETVRNLFFTSITQAEHRVDITTPYFVPDIDLMTALKTAVYRGVRVRLLIPRQPDHRIVGLASRSFYEDLLAAGIHVYLYDGAVLHAKIMTVDGEFSVIGAANYDARSFRLSCEVCQAVYSRQLAAALTDQFERDLRQARPLTREWLEGRSRWEVGKERAARLLAPLL
jgi:cardiolipin synthase